MQADRAKLIDARIRPKVYCQSFAPTNTTISMPRALHKGQMKQRLTPFNYYYVVSICARFLPDQKLNSGGTEETKHFQ